MRDSFGSFGGRDLSPNNTTNHTPHKSPFPTHANSTYSSMYSSPASSALDQLHHTRKAALDRLKGWRKSGVDTKPSSGAGSTGPQITLQPLQCKPNAREPLQQRDITDPRSLAYHANKYSVSDDASIIRRERPDLVSKRSKGSTNTTSYSNSARPSSARTPTTAPSINRLSVVSNYSLLPTPAPPSATAQTIPDSPRPRQHSFSERPATAIPNSPDLSMTSMHRTNTNSSSRTSYVPPNPVSAWDDDEEDEPKKSGLFTRFKSSRSFSARKVSSSSVLSERSSKAPSIKSVSTKSVSSKSSKSQKTPKSKSRKGNLGNKFGIDDLGDFEWNMQGYMEGDEDGSDAEIEAALRRVREAEAKEAEVKEAKETTPTPSSAKVSTSTKTSTNASTKSSSTKTSRSSTSRSTPTPESSSTSTSISPVLPPISPSQSLDLGLNERFENELISVKPTPSPNYARDHMANLLRRRANSGNQTPVPQTPVPQIVPPEQCPWDTWKYTSNHHTYQITPPDSTRSSHVYASADHPYDTSHHSMVLPESPVQLQPMSTASSSSSSSDQTKWDDISANIALIQQQIQEMSPRSRELARGFAAKELTKPATLVTPTTISPATFPTPPRPSRENVELPDCFNKQFLTMTSSPSVRPLPRRLNKLGPALEESDVSPDSSQRSSVSTRLSTAPSSPEPDMRCFV